MTPCRGLRAEWQRKNKPWWYNSTTKAYLQDLF